MQCHVALSKDLCLFPFDDAFTDLSIKWIQRHVGRFGRDDNSSFFDTTLPLLDGKTQGELEGFPGLESVTSAMGIL